MLGAKYPITWIDSEIFEINHIGFKNLMIGICHYSKQPFTVAHKNEGIRIMVVRDLFINEESIQCEEGKRCLNFTCKFNKVENPNQISYLIGKNPKVQENIEKCIKEKRNFLPKPTNFTWDEYCKGEGSIILKGRKCSHPKP